MVNVLLRSESGKEAVARAHVAERKTFDGEVGVAVATR
jgi:hypothetical protein